eukprot:XP_011681515.1 PREDICTED: sodium/hydrogen exchanger 6-like [Strongylocentrotus purpuratus]
MAVSYWLYSQYQSRKPTKKEKTAAWVIRKWYDFDYRFLKPIFTKKGADLRENVPTCCLPLAVCLTVQDDNPSINDDSDDDFILVDDINPSMPDTNGASSGPADDQGPRTLDDEGVLDGDLGLGDHQLRSRGIIGSNDPAPTSV